MATEQITVVMDVIAKMDKAEGEFKKLQGTLQKLKLPDNLDSGFKKSFSNIESLFAKYKSQLEKGFDSKASVNSFIKTSKAIDTELDKLSKHFTELTGKEITFKVKNEALKQAEQTLKDLTIAKEKFGQDTLSLKVEGIRKDEFSSLQSALRELQRITKGNTGKAAGNILEGLNTGNIQQVKKGMDDLLRSFKNVKSEAKLLDIKKAFGLDITDVVTKIINALRGVEGEMDAFSQKSKTAAENINRIKGDQVTKATKAIKEAVGDYEKLEGQVRETTTATQDFARATQSMSQQLGDLQQSTQYFFSLRNMINLLKRGIDEAVQSVKELDKAMTATAVVTDYKVSDLWRMLPEYTKVANQLGATTQGAYETMTLYYQQGLDQQQAFELGAETMKMARIAGLDYAETTDMMTAALRGFNMELNEISAKRVNDVYSELAAITASDTEELGTAMQRTASIAHSAGMSFEGTTAFLAQAIETTREPAENIGTAMKTIVARFQEMKKNPLEITEVDGEEVNYNKVDQALQSIGVSLKDTNGQFRELDQVFLDISQRWDGLTQTQQRYIATIAAGSRQQSRFIAMMDNYDRTVQLMTAANNSAGASEEQFGKTMDSLESKLNKLHNAWQQFTMGIANNDMIKLAVDGLTGFLNVTNKIIDTLSLGSGALKSFLSIFAAFTGLKAAGRIANQTIGGLGGLIDPQSSFKEGFFNGAVGNRRSSGTLQAKAISNPIVEAINAQTVALGGTLQSNKTGESISAAANYKDFKQARSEYRQLFKKDHFKIKDATSILSKLSPEQQGLLLNNSGTANRLSRGLDKYYKQFNLDDQAYKAGISAKNSLLQGMVEGKVSASELEKVINPVHLGRQVGGKLGTSIARQSAKASRDYLKTQETNIEKEVEKRLQAARESNTDWTPITDKERQRTRNQIRKEYAESFLNGENAKSDIPTWAEKTQQSISRLGEGVITTGQAFTSFGTILSSLGLDGIGLAFTTLGTTITNVGMILTSVGTVIPKVIAKVKEAGTVVKALKLAVGEAGIGGILAGTGIALGAGLAIAGIIAVSKKIEQKAKESAEKVQSTYTKAIEDIDKTEVGLKDNRDRLNELSKGIDQYGNNIGLTNDEYQEYLSLSRNVADIAPELIRGYDNQGNAIVATGDAIDVLIAKQQKLREEAIKTYTSLSAFKDTIKGIQTSDIYKDIMPSKGNGEKLFGSQIANFWGSFDKAGITSSYAAQIIEETTGRDITAMTADDIAFINQHYNDLINAIEARNPDLTEAAKQNIEDAFNNLNTMWSDVQTELTPLMDQIQQYLSLQDVDAAGLGLGQEFTTAFNNGLQNIALDAVITGDYKSIRQNAINYANDFKKLTAEGSKYNEILKEAQQAEEDYFNSLDDSNALKNYQNNIEGCADSLDEYADSAFAAGDISKQMFDAMKASAADLHQKAIEPVVSLGEALNTLSDELSEAKGAYDRFSEATKDNDFSTASDSMYKIFDEALDEKHSTAFGDNTFWTGARELMDEPTLNQDISVVRDRMKENQKMFAEGTDGYLAFRERIQGLSAESREELSKLGVEWDATSGMFTKIPEEAYSTFAQMLHLNDQSFAALLSKMQQYSDIDFRNPELVTEAIKTDERTIIGKDNRYYAKQSDIEQEIRTAYPQWNDSKVAEEINKIKQEGIPMLPSKETMESSNFDKQAFITDLKAMGAIDQSSLTKILGESGNYNKQEIADYIQAADYDFNKDQLDIDFAAIEEKLKDPLQSDTNSTLHNIDANVASLASGVTQGSLENGNPDEAREAFNQIESLKQSIYGEEGKRDTLYQQFEKGRNEKGEPLTEEEFQANQDKLNDAITLTSQTLDSLEIGYQAAIEKYGENSSQAQEYRQQYLETANVLKNLNSFLSGGQQIHYQQQQEEKQIANKESQKDYSKFQDLEVDTTGADNFGSKIKELWNTFVSTGNTQALALDAAEGTDQLAKTIGTKLKQWYDALIGKISGGSNIKNSGNTSNVNTSKSTNTTKTTNVVNTTTKKTDVQVTGQSKLASLSKALGNIQSKQIAVAANVSGLGAVISLKDALAKLKDKIVNVVTRKRTEGGDSGTGASGINNKIPYSSTFSFGSLAKGTKKGKIGPKGNGGLTLTGETGFEIAWLPDESSSMIVGANGPQMIDLPSNAVIWNHSQSKKILKQKGIPIGSANNADANASTWWDPNQKSTGSKGKKSKKTSKKSKKKSKKKNKDKTKPTINNFSIEEVVRFNIDQELTKLTDQIAKRTKDIEKSLSKIGITYNDILDSTKAQIGALESVKNKNQALYNSYQAQLNDYLSRQAIISYTDSKGKSHDKTINIAQYLNTDGSANTGAIASAGGREVQEAIYKEINSAKALVDGMNNAQKAIDDANNQIDEFHKKIADTFYNWENQITWVYDLTQRLNNIQSLRDRFSEHITLELDKVSTGFETTAQALNEISVAAKRDNKALLDQIAAQREMINARKMEMEDAYSWADEQKELSYQLGKNADQGIINQAETNLEAAKMMRNYIKSFQQREDGSIVYDIDWAQFEQDKRDTKITNTTYDAIYKQLEKLNSSTTEYNNSLKDLTSSVDQIYQNILEYQQTQIDLEADLLDGLEEQTEQDVSNLRDLGSSISDALQDLFDSVKRKLDERRQQEDNAKTERDISQKQQRLAALRANTAGGNQVEIAQLEKEIAESQQSYQRSLEDQLLDKLNQQADEAAKQRERQIDLLEIANKIGIDNRELVRKWVENPQDYQTEITNVLKNKENFGEAGFLRQEQILREINKRIVEGQNASDQLRAEDNRTDTQAQLDAESTKQKELEAEKAAADEKLANAQSELTQAINEQTNNQNALNNINSSISSTQDRLNQLKSRPEYRQYQKAQAAYAKYQEEYKQNKQSKYDKYGRLNHNYEPQLTFEQFVRQRNYGGIGAHDLSNKWIYNTHQLKEIEQLEKTLDSLKNQKHDLTSQTASIQEAVKQAEESVKQLQDESNNWAQQIVQSQQTQKELQNKITAITTDSLLSVKDVADEQLNIKADTSYFNTNGAIVSGTDKLTPEIQAEKDYAITKQEKDKRDAAAEAERQRQIAEETERQRVAAAQQAAADYQTQLANVKAIKPSKVTKDNINALYDYGAAAGVSKSTVLRDLVGAGGADPFTWANILIPILDSSGVNRWNLAATYGKGSAAEKAVFSHFKITTDKEKKKFYGDSRYKAFASGGLANYTGPAWLDGTPSKPELVLNAKDTANFIALKDVLSKVMGSTKSINNSYGGDNIFEININVDKIEKDYDVDRVADRVKKKILESSSYRNVTQVRNFR